MFIQYPIKCTNVSSEKLKSIEYTYSTKEVEGSALLSPFPLLPSTR
jgi:hypothetical protein